MNWTAVRNQPRPGAAPCPTCGEPDHPARRCEYALGRPRGGDFRRCGACGWGAFVEAFSRLPMKCPRPDCGAVTPRP